MYSKLTERTILQLNKRNGSTSTAQTSLTRTPGRQTAQSRTNSTTTVGSYVTEVPGAETETAERNGPETALQTIWSDLPDETIRKAVLSFRKLLMACVEAQGGHSNIRSFGAE